MQKDRRANFPYQEWREELLAVEEDRMHGSKGYSVGEVAAMMRTAIREAADHGKTE